MSNPLDEIQARASAATQGPWEATPNDRIVSSTKTWPEGDPYDVAGMFGHKGAVVEGCRTPDAEFIAHAREDVPALVKALRAVEAILVDWDKFGKQCLVRADPTSGLPDSERERQQQVAEDCATDVRRVRDTIREALG